MFRKLLAAHIAEAAVHLVVKPIDFAPLACNAAELSNAAFFTAEAAAIVTFGNGVAIGSGCAIGKSVGRSRLFNPRGNLPLGFPIIPFLCGPRIIASTMRITLAPAFRFGIVENVIGFIAGLEAEVLAAVMAKVVAGHRDLRWLRAVMASESGTVDSCLKGVVAR